MSVLLPTLLAAGAAATPSGCGGDPAPPPAPTIGRRGTEFFAAGQVVDAATPIVTWLDEGGYDAYRTVPRFEEPARRQDGSIVREPRFGTRAVPEELAGSVDPEDGWSLEELRQVVHQFVIHYDVCGTSRQCFKILQDKRNLSVHFMLDVDGTLYQTLDLKERAWHAGAANGGSVGVEIAHIGAYPAPGHPTLRQWYRAEEEGGGVRVTFPAWLTPGVRTPDFVPRPSRPLLMTGVVQGRRLYQHDFTDEQYEALTALCAALHRTFPRIRLEVPRNDDGTVRTTVLSEAERLAWDGLLGHWHVSGAKTDPGPAFDWERVLAGARARVAGDGVGRTR